MTAAPGSEAPLVFLDVERSGGCLWLVLANPTAHPAYDVEVTFSGPLPGRGGEEDVAGLLVFRHLSLLRPGREIRVFLDVARLLFAREQETVVEGKVSWRTREGARLGEAFRHDLAVWDDLGEIEIPLPYAGPRPRAGTPLPDRRPPA